MRKHLRLLSLAACVCLGPGATMAAERCQKGAIEKLHASAPDGYAIYQQLKDKAFFVHWLNCDDGQLGLATAVHESVHYLTADDDAFPLVDGGEIMRPHAVSAFYPPTRIAGKFKSNDFVTTYLRPGRATSSSDFLYLLDELNAYTHDLNASIDLKSLRRDDEYTDNRDGLAALMAFVALYLERARASEPATWSGLQQPEVAKTVATLWDRAEKVMIASCGIPNYGTEDKTFIGQFCRPDARSSLQIIIGREPVCPTECLDAAADVSLPASAAPHTIWSRRIARRVGSTGSDEATRRE